MNPTPTAPPARLLSLDAYRGAVMILLACNGFGLAAFARQSGSPSLSWLEFHASHPEWISQFRIIGLSLWDMIQPAFMFIVGVAVPYSFAKRQSLGDSRGRILKHALWRCLLLILLGVLLQSTRTKETNWIFTNVLCQIGLGYGLLVVMAGRTYRAQIIVGAVILALSWLAFALYPVALAAEGAVAKAGQLPGFFAHWSMHTNIAADFDRWFLNLFPRSEPFTVNQGGYTTLNFIPASVTMLLGLMCGQLLRDERHAPREKLRRLLIGGAICLGIGVLLGATICPIVKRLWTPSWALFSGAYAIWLLALFYWIIDLRGWRSWAFPCVVAGMNSLALFVMGSTLRGWTVGQLHIHLPGFLFAEPWGAIVDATLAGLLFWLVCFWMYRQKVFIRL